MYVCMYVCMYQGRFKVGPVRSKVGSDRSSFFLLWGFECVSCFIISLRGEGRRVLRGDLLYECLMKTETINLSPLFSPSSPIAYRKAYRKAPITRDIVVIKVVVVIIMLVMIVEIPITYRVILFITRQGE